MTFLSSAKAHSNLIVKNIIFSFISIAILFFIIEAVSTLVYNFTAEDRIAKKGWTDQPQDYYIAHPTLGWVLNPGFIGYREGAHYSINSGGFRDREFSIEKPKHTLRIICLGDSITEGPFVNNNQTYPKLLEDKLNSHPSEIKFEVMNFGIGDYGLQQEYLLLRDLGLKYKPELVILGYYLNDARGFVAYSPIWFRVSGVSFLNQSKFVYYMNKIIRKYAIKRQYKLWEKYRFKWNSLYNTMTWQTNKDDAYHLIQLAERDWGIAWTEEGQKEVRKTLALFLELRQKYNFKFVVLCFPNSVQVYGAFQGSEIAVPQRRMAEFCKENNIPYLDLMPMLAKYNFKDIFKDNCHYTKKGHEIVAQLVYKELVGSGVLK